MFVEVSKSDVNYAGSASIVLSILEDQFVLSGQVLHPAVQLRAGDVVVEADSDSCAPAPAL